MTTGLSPPNPPSQNTGFPILLEPRWTRHTNAKVNLIFYSQIFLQLLAETTIKIQKTNQLWDETNHKTWISNGFVTGTPNGRFCHQVFEKKHPLLPWCFTTNDSRNWRPVAPLEQKWHSEAIATNGVDWNRTGSPPHPEKSWCDPRWWNHTKMATRVTLQETNISPKNGILKMIFLFPR